MDARNKIKFSEARIIFTLRQGNVATWLNTYLMLTAS
jgi:hypothetical protein